MKELQETIFLGNPLSIWLLALGIVLVSLIVILILKRILLIRIKKWTAKTDTTIDDFLIERFEKSLVPLLYIAAFYFALNTLLVSPAVSRIMHVAFLFVITFYILGIITAVVQRFIFSFLKTHDEHETKQKQARGLIIVINVVIWVLGMIFIIDNLGYNVTTLITGLGIGGIAIALAAQSILGDLFSYFIIFFDRPFEIGDFIIVDDKMGTIEYIGIKTTRIKTLNGEQLICANTDLTNSRVHNYKRMQERRIVFNLGVIYGTPAAQIKNIPVMVTDIIKRTEGVRFDRGHFSGFGDSSLDFEFVYFILSAEYNDYMDKQQEIYLAVLTEFEAQEIDFAFPTRTLFINNPEKAEKEQNEPGSFLGNSELTTSHSKIQ